jgi:hypothetical protein
LGRERVSFRHRFSLHNFAIRGNRAATGPAYPLYDRPTHRVRKRQAAADLRRVERSRCSTLLETPEMKPGPDSLIATGAPRVGGLIV